MSDGKLHPDYLGIGTKVAPEHVDRYEGLGYTLEEKYDGWWCHLQVGPSGRISMSTRRNNPIQDAGLPGIGSANQGVTLIGEWLPKEGKVWLFDIIHDGKTDLRLMPQEFRRFALLTLAERVSFGPRVHITPSFDNGFKAVYAAIVADGGEGVVLKNTQSLYHSRKKDQKTSLWVKSKPEYSVRQEWAGGDIKWSDPDLAMAV